MVIGLHFMTQKIENNIPDLTNKELSIQVNLSGLSFYVLNRPSNTIEIIQHYTFETVQNPEQLLIEIESIFNDKAIYKALRKVTIVHVNTLSSFVPKSLFNESNLSDYLKFNVKILPTDFLTFDEIGNSDLINVYVPYVNINNFFFDFFGTFEYKHHASILIETLLYAAPKSEDALMYVHVEDTHFEIIVIKDKKLLFYNSFEYSTKEDFIYYILFTAEQLNLNPEKFILQCIGNITEDDSTYKVAHTYIRNISIYRSLSNYEYPEDQISTNHSSFILENSF